MSTRKLEPSEWREYFDGVAKRQPSMRVVVSVMADDLGVQPEAQDAELIGITYDSKEGFLEIGTPDVTHRIDKPDEIYVQEEGGELVSVEVLAADGTKQVIELKPS
jgi:hypothetical protein